MPGDLCPEDYKLLDVIKSGFDDVGDLLEAIKLRAALQEAMRLAAEGNKYLEEQEPWFTIKSDPGKASRSIYTSLHAIDSLKIIFSPFLPFSSEKLHKMLGFKGSVRDTNWTWDPYEIERNQVLGKIEPLFTKLDKKIIETEMQSLVN